MLVRSPSSSSHSAMRASDSPLRGLEGRPQGLDEKAPFMAYGNTAFGGKSAGRI